jgi:uroporphyrinogen-III synthase
VPDLGASSLAGKRVVVTRAAAQSAELTQRLSALGATPILFPLVSFAPPDDFGPLDAGLARLADFDWLIFTSENTVHAVADRLAPQGRSLPKTGKPYQVAAVGPTTARAAEQAGFSITYSAKTHSGVALANELGETVRDKRVFLPRSNRANPDLPAALKQHGAEVTEAVAYKTLPPPELDPSKLATLTPSQTDAILFFSPTAVEHFAELIGSTKLGTLQSEITIVAVGPITATALQKSGVTEIVVAADTTPSAVVHALEQHFATLQRHSSAGANRG